MMSGKNALALVASPQYFDAMLAGHRPSDEIAHIGLELRLMSLPPRLDARHFRPGQVFVLAQVRLGIVGIVVGSGRIVLRRSTLQVEQRQVGARDERKRFG